MTPTAASPAGYETATEGPFRPIQYLGSKVRVLDAIRSALDEVDPDRGRVLDLFSGSGVVAADLARERPVIAVDVQEYARVLASALLAPARIPEPELDGLLERADEAVAALAREELAPLLELELEAGEAAAAGDPSPLCDIVEHGSIVAAELGCPTPPGPLSAAMARASRRTAAGLTLTHHYGGVFFGYAQALRLDCLLLEVRRLAAADRDTGLAAVLGAASESVNSVGSHFAQPIRPRNRDGEPKRELLAATARRRRRDPAAIFAALVRRYAELPDAAFDWSAVRGDYGHFLESEPEPIAAVYADPPYTRDHYSRFYHVLETIALGDDPSVSTVTVGNEVALSRGLYRVDRHQSPFCIRSQAPAAFARLFSGVRELGAGLVLSYSPYSSGTAARPEPRLLTIDQLVDLAAEQFSDVSVRSAGQLSHSRFNSQHLNGAVESEAESLLVCVP